MLKKLLFKMILGILIFIFSCGIQIYAAEKEAVQLKETDLYALGAVLLDGDSGRILFGKNMDEKRANASTTKIMTCILVLEQGNLEDHVQVSAYAASQPKVHLGMKRGETYIVKDLLYSMMLESHNDSAVALAEYMVERNDGSHTPANERTVEESKEMLLTFSRMMNDKAKAIGCMNTCFLTPNGLDASVSLKQKNGEIETAKHGTTARDLAHIMSYCVMESGKKDAFISITSCLQYSFSDTSNQRLFQCNNHNALLWTTEGAISGKTGFTGDAGYCYVGAIRRMDRTWIVALLASGWPNAKNNKWKDTDKLIHYGMENYIVKSFPKAEIDALVFPKILVNNATSNIFGEDTYLNVALKNCQYPEQYLMKTDEKLQVLWKLKEKMDAPVEKGDKVGELKLCVGKELIYEEEIVAEQTIERIDFKWCFQKVIESYCFQFKNV